MVDLRSFLDGAFTCADNSRVKEMLNKDCSVKSIGTDDTAGTDMEPP